MEFFKHFSEEGHHGFLKDISVKIIDRLTGGNRMRESFWQYRLDCFAPKARGGGYLVYLSHGDVPNFRVSYSPIFSRTGYQKKANFLEQVVKTCQKTKFCYNVLLFSQIFVFLRILFTDFFKNRVSFEGKNSGAG